MRILYVTTRFPVYSETFLQREVRAMRAAGEKLRVVSLHGGAVEFEGLPVARFKKASLLRLLYLLPWVLLRHGESLLPLARALRIAAPPNALNLWENLLGMGLAIVDARSARLFGPDIIHAAWAGGPASYALVLSALSGVPFSMGAHAYDVFEGGGDWLLATKASRAALVHSSSEAAAARMRSLAGSGKVACIRRGLTSLPPLKPLRERRAPLRLLCVARLVEKKGLPQQLEIYAALRAGGLEFEARIAGDGPMRAFLEAEARRRGLEDGVTFLGRLSEGEVEEQMRWADVLLHTGVVASSGDRDGLPNVVPEAMAVGTVVVASPVSAVVEAISDGRTGLLRSVRQPEAWLGALGLTQSDDARCEEIRTAARAWVEREFMAERNTASLLRRMERCVAVPHESR